MGRHCIIIDNNRTLAFRLQLLLHTNDFANVFVATELQSINRLLAEENIEIIFVRTKLWHHRLLKATSQISQPPAIVFLSSQREKFKEDLYEQVVYHISEPYTKENVQAILQRIEKEKTQSSLDFLFIKQQRRYRKIFFETIELAESLSGNYIRLHTTSGNYMVVGTLNGFMNRLPQALFRRISDKLIIPEKETGSVKGNVFFYKGKEMILTHKHTRRYQRKVLQPVDVL